MFFKGLFTKGGNILMLKRINNLSKRHLRNNFVLYFILSLSFIIGIFIGAILINKLSTEQSSKISNHFSWIFNFVKEQDFNSINIFISSLLSNMKILFIVWILGLTSIGLLIIPLIIVWKGVAIGFTVGFLVKGFGMKGFIFSLAGLLPHYLIMIPGFLAIGAIGISNSIYVGKGRRSKMNQVDINEYSILMLLFFLIIIFGCFIEGFFTPYFLKLLI